MPKTDERLLAHAKAMRREMSAAEARLWYRLPAKRLAGIKVVRQSVRRSHIADFVARSHRLVIEVDGHTHAGREARDARRTEVLEAQGYRVTRFTNAEVMQDEADVVAAILAAVSAPLLDPLPGGERETLA